MSSPPVFPSPDDVLDATGVVPEPLEADPDVMLLEFPVAADETVALSWFELDASVTFRWIRAGETIAEISHEDVTLLTFLPEPGTVTVRVEFESASTIGALTARIHPTVRIDGYTHRHGH